MRVLRDLISAVLIGLLVVLALEGGLRLAHDRYEASFYQSDPERGYSLRPNAQGWNITEGEAYIQVNSGGMRDLERPFQRPAHTLRVAMVGASEAASFEVPREESFESSMERNLNPVMEPRRNRLEVLNFGVPGYSLPQEYLTLHNYVWRYNPQVVVLLWNQFLLLKNTHETNPQSDQPLPFYVLQDGRLTPENPAPAMLPQDSASARRNELKNQFADLMNKSYLLCMLHQAAVELPGQIRSIKAALTPGSGRPVAAASTRPQDYMQWWPYTPNLPEMQENWKITEAFLREMKEECDRHGAELHVVIVDEQMQSHPDLTARENFMRSKGLASLDESDQRLERFCRENGIGVFPLAPPMSAYAVAHHFMLHGEGSDNAGHWNKTGHRLAGQFMADALLNQSAVVQAWAGKGK